jgi:hypothetical protein
MSHKVLRRAAALVLAAVAAPVAILAASPPARAATPHLCETYGRYCLGSADLNVGTYVQERTPGRDLVLTPLGGRYDGHPTFLFQFSSDNSKCVGTQSPGGGSLIIQPCNGGIGIVWAQIYIGTASGNRSVYEYINRYESEFYGDTRYLEGHNILNVAFGAFPTDSDGYYKFSWE